MYPINYNVEIYNPQVDLPHQKTQPRGGMTNEFGNQHPVNNEYVHQNFENPMELSTSTQNHFSMANVHSNENFQQPMGGSSNTQNRQWMTYQPNDWHMPNSNTYQNSYQNMNNGMQGTSMAPGWDAAPTVYPGYYEQFTEYAQGKWSMSPLSSGRSGESPQTFDTAHSSPNASTPDGTQYNDAHHSIARDICITLKTDHWNVFRANGQSEQLANNAGRRLFPTLEFDVKGLEPDAHYIVGLQMVRVSGELDYDESQRKWVSKSSGDQGNDIPERTNEVFSYPKIGSQLMMDYGLNFETVKLYTIGKKTFNKAEAPKMIRVYTRQKYIPQVRIIKQMPDGTTNEVARAVFETASFVVVSKLKDQLINKLRSDGNKHSRFKDKSLKGTVTPTHFSHGYTDIC